MRTLFVHVARKVLRFDADLLTGDWERDLVVIRWLAGRRLVFLWYRLMHCWRYSVVSVMGADGEVAHTTVVRWRAGKSKRYWSLLPNGTWEVASDRLSESPPTCAATITSRDLGAIVTAMSPWHRIDPRRKATR